MQNRLSLSVLVIVSCLSFIERSIDRINRIIENKQSKYNKHNETTVMKSDSEREHGRRRIGLIWFWWGCEEILRELVFECIF